MSPTYSTLDQGYDYYISDKWGMDYHFKIFSFPVPTGLLSEAREVIDKEGREPYVFNILSEFDEDKSEAELLLKHKLQDGINKRHLKSEDGKLEIRDEGRLSGRIGWDDDFNDTNFDLYFMVDGKKVTIENFVRMLQPYCDFKFNFEILDPSD